MTIERRLKIGNYIIKVKFEATSHNRLKVIFPYNKSLINEIKAMSGAKWHGYDDINPGKYWTVTDNERNWFQINYLSHLAEPDNYNNPYQVYDKPVIEHIKESLNNRPLYPYQIDAVNFVLTRLGSILAYDMGSGKSLIAIEVLDYLNKIVNLFNKRELNNTNEQILWVGPKSALYAVQMEFIKWKASILPKFVTYDSLPKLVDQLITIPKVVIFDEASKIRNPQAKRSIAAAKLAEMARKKYPNKQINNQSNGQINNLILLMTGTPAPHNPSDWFHLCEIACPGYLKEGSQRAFLNRLALVKQEESLSGGLFPKLVTWFDNPDKCKICGRFKEDFNHDSEGALFSGKNNTYHRFEPSKNEVAYLYQRMRGLVDVKLKKDILSWLPDKIYRTINIEPSESILRSLNLILKKSRTSIEALTLARELSDGFQYVNISDEDESKSCELCGGDKVVEQPIYVGPDDIPEQSLERIKDEYWSYIKQICPACNGTGNYKTIKRKTVSVKSPKEDIITDLLDEFEELSNGRIIIYAGFTGSIDKLTKLVIKHGWDYIKSDGKGWTCSINNFTGAKPVQLLDVFQTKQNLYSKIVFIGHPGASGMGLNLTASPVIIYYSNTFNGEDRMQSIERAHRPGMDLNKGLTIIDLIHLPTDKKVLDNLNSKKNLQSLTMGELVESLSSSSQGIRYL